MLAALAMVFLALRKGLELRRRRQRGMRGRGAWMAAHIALAKPAVILVLVGLLGGPLSAVWLREWAPLRTLHGWLGVLSAGLFIATGWLGLRLLGRRSRSVDLHGWLGLLAVLVAALAMMAGFVLLP